MDTILRSLKISELSSRILLYEMENTSLMKELSSKGTNTGRRIQLYKRGERLDFEYREAQNDLKWLRAEERLRRPDRVLQAAAPQSAQR